MDNQTDNQLKNHIRDVFENFEDPTADAGWLLLREKYPEKKRRAIAWLWWSAAAILLLFVGIHLYQVEDKIKPEQISYKAPKDHQQNIIVDRNQPARSKKKAVTPVTALSTTIAKTKTTGINNIDKTYANDKQINTKPTVSDNPQIIHKQTTTLPADSTLLASSGETKQKQSVADSFRNANNIAANTSSIARKPATPVYTATPNPPKNMADKSYDKSVSLALYGSTFASYAKNSNTSVSAGAGITADIPIGKNLKLSTGIALAQNRLNYGNGLSYGNYSAPQGNTSNGTTTTPTATPVNPSSTNYNASLISLDVPVNLKYEFSSTGKTFVSAGFSSGTFISQDYSFGFLQSVQAVSNANSSNFYFARVLNFSFGMNYPLGKTNSVIIEPFVKYPLGGLGDQQIKFGATGINLKFNFKTSQK